MCQQLPPAVNANTLRVFNVKVQTHKISLSCQTRPRQASGKEERKAPCDGGRGKAFVEDTLITDPDFQVGSNFRFWRRG